MLITPPTQPKVQKMTTIYKVSAHCLSAGGFVLTVCATGFMLGSASLAAAAGLYLSIGERLRERAHALFAAESPLSAVTYRAKEMFYQRRRQGVALD